MGSSTVLTRLNRGDTIAATEFNTLREALADDFVSRDFVGTPTTDVGQLGTVRLFWTEAYARIANLSSTLVIDTSGNNFTHTISATEYLSIEDTGVQLDNIRARESTAASDPVRIGGAFQRTFLRSPTDGNESIFASRVRIRFSGRPIQIHFNPEADGIVSSSGTAQFQVEVANAPSSGDFADELVIAGPYTVSTTGNPNNTSYSFVWLPPSDFGEDGDIADFRLRALDQDMTFDVKWAAWELII